MTKKKTTSVFPGIQENPNGTYSVRPMIGGTRVQLGTFASFDEAMSVLLAARSGKLVNLEAVADMPHRIYSKATSTPPAGRKSSVQDDLFIPQEEVNYTSAREEQQKEVELLQRAVAELYGPAILMTGGGVQLEIDGQSHKFSASVVQLVRSMEEKKKL